MSATEAAALLWRLALIAPLTCSMPAVTLSARRRDALIQDGESGRGFVHGIGGGDGDVDRARLEGERSGDENAADGAADRSALQRHRAALLNVSGEIERAASDGDRRGRSKRVGSC